ncbi:MAG: sulfite exporter TauE/SafE family protein [Rhodospirillaceae bacterium]
MDSLVELLGQPAGVLIPLAIAITVGGVIKGITAIGLPTVTISFAITFHLLPPKEAIALVVVPIIVTNLWQAIRAHGRIDPLKRFWPLIAVFLVCLWIGSKLLAVMNTHLLFAILGSAVAVFAASNLWKPRPHPITPGTERWAGPVAGVIGGLLGGTTTIWGPPLMMYFVLLKLTKDEWIRTIGMVWFTGAIPLAVFYWQNGILNPSNVYLSAAACVPGMVGILIGEQIRKVINEEAFRRVMLFILFLFGLNLIRRAIF